jgi:regulator of protease activity HflC (stomatin/prohibitin superfamily)
MSPLILLVFIIIMIFSLKSIYIVKESERILLYRLGKFKAYYGAGLIITYPIIDKKLKLSLPQEIPNWYELKEEELNSKIFELLKQKYHLELKSLV